MRLGAALLVCAALPAGAASIAVTVRDSGEAPLEDAVVFALPKGARAERAPRPAEIAQKDRQFAPHVTVVQAGASVRFPNRDPFRHHVYSFSPAKRFEIKLYVGTPAEPEIFDKAGEVVLGCNIHDNMVGYVYVVDTPHFGKTDKAGRARIEGVPPGDYELRVWHPGQSAPAGARAISARGEETIAATFDVALKAAQRPPPN